MLRVMALLNQVSLGDPFAKTAIRARIILVLLEIDFNCLEVAVFFEELSEFVASAMETSISTDSIHLALQISRARTL